MNKDEAPLTLDQQRRFTETELRHWERLTEDARVCGLKAIYQRRRDRLRQLRQQKESVIDAHESPSNNSAPRDR